MKGSLSPGTVCGIYSVAVGESILAGPVGAIGEGPIGKLRDDTTGVSVGRSSGDEDEHSV